MPNYLTVETAAQAVSLSSWTIRKAIRAGEIAFSRIGGRKAIRIAESDLEAWLTRHRQDANVADAA